MSDRPSIALSSVVVRSPEVLEAAVERDVVLMRVDKEHYFGLNAVGSDIWRRLASPIAVEDLLDALCRDYEGNADIIRADLLAVLGLLAQNGLVRLDEPAASIV